MEQNPYQPPEADVTEVSSEAIRIREEHIAHEASIKALGALYYLTCIMFVINGLIQLTSGNWTSSAVIPGVAIIALGILFFWIGAGLRALRARVKHFAGIFSAIGLIGFPIGTLINGYILYLLYSKKGKMVFSDEYKQVQLATPDVKYKTSVIVWIFLILLLLMIAAAIVIPIFSHH